MRSIAVVDVVFIVATLGSTLTIERLADFMTRQVAGYKQIREWAIVDTIPRTPSGKILRRALR